MTVRATILDLLGDGPATTDALCGALRRLGLPSAQSTVRHVCDELRRAGTVATRIVRTPRHRMGLALWSLASESAERVELAVAMLRADARAGVSFGGLRAPRVA